MTNPKFATLPKRFDPKYAADGIWFQPYDEALNVEFPSFKLSLVDPTSDHFQETAERLADRVTAPKKGFRQPAKLSKKDRAMEEAGNFVRNFIEVALVDWTVEDDKGKVIPFSKELATLYFDHNDQDKRWLLGECVKFASNLANYQPDGQTEAPEGN
jgi:hypothetical protein